MGVTAHIEKDHTVVQISDEQKGSLSENEYRQGMARPEIDIGTAGGERKPVGERTTLVTGGAGFIGGHLVADLRRQGMRVRAVDIKPFDEWYQRFDDVDNVRADLRLKENCEAACRDARTVYQLAADMGGMGFIEHNKALCMLSVLVNTHMLQAAQAAGVDRFFYSSSACVYNADKQRDENVVALKEEDAYPALPEDGYGWEKLFSERMCRHFREDFGLELFGNAPDSVGLSSTAGALPPAPRGLVHKKQSTGGVRQ